MDKSQKNKHKWLKYKKMLNITNNYGNTNYNNCQPSKILKVEFTQFKHRQGKSV